MFNHQDLKELCYIEKYQMNTGMVGKHLPALTANPLDQIKSLFYFHFFT
jgi:hypothetical protein